MLEVRPRVRAELVELGFGAGDSAGDAIAAPGHVPNILPMPAAVFAQFSLIARARHHGEA